MLYALFVYYGLSVATLSLSVICVRRAEALGDDLEGGGKEVTGKEITA